MPRNESAQSGPTNWQHAGRMPHWTRVAVRIQRARLENAVRTRVCNYLGYLAQRNRIRPRFQKDPDTQSKCGGPGSKATSVVLTPLMRFAPLVAKSFWTMQGNACQVNAAFAQGHLDFVPC